MFKSVINRNLENVFLEFKKKNSLPQKRVYFQDNNNLNTFLHTSIITSIIAFWGERKNEERMFDTNIFFSV